MSWPCGSPIAFQRRLPSTVGHEPLCSAAISFLLSTAPTLAIAAAATWPTAYASAEVGSIAPLPYAFAYALTNSALPADFSSGNQSPEEKIPFTFAAPTFDGNSAGSLGPFERKRNFGLYLSW